MKFVEKQTDKSVKIVRTDNGTEYLNADFEKFSMSRGIRHQKTAPYTPQQNGVAERMNRTLIEKAKCLLFDAKLPKCYWAEAVNMAAYLINRSLSAAHNKIPYEIFCDEKVDVTDLKLFGTEVMVFVPKQKRHKLDKNSQKMIFVGYDENTKGVRCVDIATRKLLVSRNVKFLDPQLEVTLEMDEVRAESSTPETPKAPHQTSTPKGKENLADLSVDESETESPDDPKDETYHPEGEIFEDAVEIENGSKNVGVMTRSKKKEQGPIWFSNLAILNDENYAFRCDEGNQADDPECFEDLSDRKDKTKWQKAMKEEIDSLVENDTWKLTELPKGHRAIKTKWVYKTKRDSNGEVVRFKARLVAKGYTQRYGIDYEETYAPVVRYTSVRILMALAAEKNLKIHQMDAVTAFLQGDVEEEIYLEQPKGFADGSERVCKLNRAIYGLKQAGRQWNVKLDTSLKEIGLRSCKMDPCIYYTRDLELMIAIYVDDFLIFYKDATKLNDLKKTLCTKFKMKDMGSAKGCIGIRIKQSAGSIELDQETYVNEVLRRFGMLDSKPIGNPCDTNVKLSKCMVVEENAEKSCGNVPYQQAVGCLLFIAQATRPDISFAVNDVSRFNNCHELAHWKAVKRIFRYLKSTANFKLVYSQCKRGELVGFTDADWASDVDCRKSVTGYVFVMSGAAVSWKSNKQQTVALSSTEAEYIALAATVQEAIWLRQLGDELGMTKRGTPCPLYCDNQSAIKLAESTGYRPRSRHIDIKYHFLRQHVENKTVMINFVATNENVADVLTKSVDKQKLVYCAQEMGLK